MQIDSFQATIIETIRAQPHWNWQRAIGASGSLTGIELVLKLGQSSSDKLMRDLFHEVEVANRKLPDTLLIPHRIVLFNQQYALLYLGTSLIPWKREESGISVQTFFKFAKDLVHAIEGLHRAGYTHGHLSPECLWTRGDQLVVSGLERASEASQEVKSIVRLSDLQENLPYLAPEQTGRSHRSSDYRSDYYSLGMLFYLYLVGRPAFTSENPLDLIYSHLTQPLPKLPHSGEIDQFLRHLVEKDPDQRYQSSAAILEDLGQLEASYRQGSPSKFVPGRNDFPEHLLFPQKIYGRESEIERLLALIEKNSSETVMISGESGIGKSSLIRELVLPFSQARGYLIQSKIDQFQKNSALFGWKIALLGCFDLLIGDQAYPLAEMKADLLNALGNQIGVLTDLIPELSGSLGKYPPPFQVGPDEGRARLLDVVASTLRVLSKKVRFAFFIDDLQWADSASIALMEACSCNPIPNFTLMGSYRSNEVNSDHPLYQILEKLRSAHAVVEIKLEGLTPESIAAFLKDLLVPVKGTSVDLRPLSELLIKRTLGNPFYIHQVIKKLYTEKAILRNLEQKRWELDPKRVEALNLSHNCVDLLVTRLGALNPSLKRFLSAGAALGSRFSPEVIQNVLHLNDADLESHTSEALREDLLRREGPELAFLHDKLQQACYQLPSTQELQALHEKMGEALEKAPFEKRDVLAIANQYAHSNLNSLEASPLRVNRIEAFLAAALLSKKASEFVKALEWLELGRSLFIPTLWSKHSNLGRKLLLEMSDTAFRVGRTELCWEIAETLLMRSQSSQPLERAEVLRIRAEQEHGTGNSAAALHTCVGALAELGFPVEVEVSEQVLEDEFNRLIIELKLIQKSGNRLLSIIEKGLIQDERILLICRILSSLASPAYNLGNFRLMNWVVLQGMTLIIQHGLFDGSVYTVNLIGHVLNRKEYFEISRDIGEIGLLLVNHPVSTDRALAATGYHIFLCGNAWIQLSAFEREAHFSGVFELSLETLCYESFFCAHHRVTHLADYYPLGITEDFHQNQFPRFEKTGFQTPILDYLSVFWFYDSLFQSQSMPATETEGATQNSLFYRKTAELLNQFLLLGPEKANALSKEVFAFRKAAFSSLAEFKCEIIFAICALCSGDSLSEEVRLVRERLVRLAKHNPRNFLYFHQWIEAEAQLAQGERPSGAIQAHFSKALDGARADSNFLFEGLIAERYALFALKCLEKEEGKRLATELFLRSYQTFKNWQASSKLKVMQETYPEFLGKTAKQGSESDSFSNRINQIGRLAKILNDIPKQATPNQIEELWGELLTQYNSNWTWPLQEALPRSKTGKAISEEELQPAKQIRSYVMMDWEGANLLETLQAKIKEKTKEIQLILDYIPYGIFSIHSNGLIEDEFSPITETLLGVSDLAGQEGVLALFYKSDTSKDLLIQVRGTLADLFNKRGLPNEEILSSLPKAIHQGTVQTRRDLALDWIPVLDRTHTEARLNSILVVVRDVTELNRARQEMETWKDKIRELEAEMLSKRRGEVPVTGHPEERVNRAIQRIQDSDPNASDQELAAIYDEVSEGL